MTETSLSQTDIIGEAQIDLKDVIIDSALTKRPLGLNKKYYNDYMKAKGYKFEFKDDNTFWVSIMGRNDKGEMTENGKLRIQIDIYPKLA